MILVSFQIVPNILKKLYIGTSGQLAGSISFTETTPHVLVLLMNAMHAHK